jgi:hypothetical protein
MEGSETGIFLCFRGKWAGREWLVQLFRCFMQKRGQCGARAVSERVACPACVLFREGGSVGSSTE